MSLIVFGGSFDPPHRGHTRLLRAALRELKSAHAVVVPAYRSPLKSSARVGARERLALTRGALRAELPERLLKRVSVDPFEIARDRLTYTFQTLRHFRHKHPGERLYFLCGSDSAKTLTRWARPNELARACRFLIGKRPGIPIAKATNFDIRALPGTFPEYSSTEIRLRILLDRPVKPMLGKSVLKLLQERGLYGFGLRAKLSGELKPGRYAHTLAVARHAAELAELHGLDPERAALAGLLHDCGRAIAMHRMAAFVRRHGIRVPSLDETAARQPMLMHAHASEFRARAVYGIEDSEVLSAVRKHTLGDAVMHPLDRLLYAADSSSSDRSYPGVGKIRAAARRDLDEGFALAVRFKLENVLACGKWLHPSTAAVWNEAVEHL